MEDSPEKEVHREKLRTTVVALDLDDGGDRRHRRIDRMPTQHTLYKERRSKMQTQTIMVMEPCSRCGQPIAPGEPAMQTASVDLDEYGRAVSLAGEGVPPQRGAATRTTGPQRRHAGRP